MSIPALTTTTLTSAIDAFQRRFAIGSTTGINGVGSLTSPQSMIVIGGEPMLVQNVPVSGTVEVMRGQGGQARPHVAGSRVYAGAASRFSTTAAGRVGLHGRVGLAGESSYLPPYRLPLGVRVTDDDGAEFVLCDFTATVHAGVTVGISNDGNFTAAPLTTAHQGAVGVVGEPTSSSDTWGWVQIYGYCSAQEAGGTSAATSAYIPIVASSVSSPDAGMAALIGTTSTPQRLIYGMFIVGAATTNVTSASSHTGVAVPVFLSYPYVMLAVTDVGLS